MQFVCVIAFNYSNKLKSRIEDSCESHIYHGCDELMDFLLEVDALKEFTATMKADTKKHHENCAYSCIQLSTNYLPQLNINAISLRT